MIFTILGSLGGVTAFIGGVFIIVRGVVHQTQVTRDNTAALDRLTRTIEKLDGVVDDHTTRIVRLESKP